MSIAEQRQLGPLALHIKGYLAPTSVRGHRAGACLHLDEFLLFELLHLDLVTKASVLVEVGQSGEVRLLLVCQRRLVIGGEKLVLGLAKFSEVRHRYAPGVVSLT
jgi:hypothetical protein